MRPGWWMAWLGLPLSAACASLGASDSGNDPDAGSQPGTTSGTVGATCAAEINLCGWVALECSGDPACAHWYACVLDCHPTSGLQGCFDQCAQGQSLSSNAAAVAKCLLEAHNGTCSPPTAVSDAAAEDSAITDPKTDAGPNQYATCEACLWGACEAQITACTNPADSPPDCTDYKHVFLGCAPSDSQLGMEKCLLAADSELSAAHKDFCSFGAMACVVYNCADLCLPSDYRACAECSRKECSEAWDMYLHDALAQDLAWCLDGCAAGSAECTAACKAAHGAGAGVLSALIACQSQSCPSCP